MKKMGMVGVVAALLAGVAHAASWRLFLTDDERETAYFMDKSSIKRDGEYATAWVMLAHGAPVTAERSSKMLVRVYCKRDIFQFLAFYNYSDEGTVLGSYLEPTKPEPIIPDTLMESVASHLCGKRQLGVDVFLAPERTTKIFFDAKRNARQASDAQ